MISTTNFIKARGPVYYRVGTHTSPSDALEGGMACVETKGRLRRFVNDFVFANRKLIGHNRRGHLFRQ